MTTTNFINPDLYNAYYSLLNKVITNYQSIFAEIVRLKEARKTLTYNPSLKYYLTPPFGDAAHYFDAQIVDHNIKEDISLYNIIDFAIDGIYEGVKDSEEYKHCIQVMDSDATIKPHTNRGIVILHVHQNLTHWKYISHFLKSMVFHYFDNNYMIDVDAFNKYYNDLESFFYQDQLELVDITPLHHFKYLSLVNKMLVPTPVSIILSQVLRIVPVTRENKIRLWNRFPISRIDKSLDGIEYIFEYNFKSDKYSRLEARIDTRLVFSAAVTLLRLVDNDCGIYDRTTVTKLDLPINLIGLDFSVTSLGVEYSSHPHVVLPILDNFKKLWDTYSDLLLRKVFDNKRYEGDRFANFKISIARFNDSFERKDGVDQFIDNVVALEALFSKEDDPYSYGSEILSKRLAIFLEKDPNKREDLFCEMIRLYRQRNEIIHGGYTEKYDIVKTREFLIRSYLKYFEFLKYDHFSHASFIRLLDWELSLITREAKECPD
jgi:hypothetical protein